LQSTGKDEADDDQEQAIGADIGAGQMELT
jgi:hypothetical protein